MKTHIITFLGAGQSDKRYEYELGQQVKVGRVFPEALADLFTFDQMYVCVTTKAKETN
jgi:hypothetical protein